MPDLILPAARAAHDFSRVETAQLRCRWGFAAVALVSAGGSSGAALVAPRRRAVRLMLLADARRLALPSFLSVPSSMASVLSPAEKEYGMSDQLPHTVESCSA